MKMEEKQKLLNQIDDSIKNAEYKQQKWTDEIMRLKHLRIEVQQDE